MKIHYEGPGTSSETKDHSINGSKFKGVNPDTDQVTISTTSGKVTANADGITFVCPVELPDDVTVTAAVVQGNAAAAAEDWTLVRASHGVDAGSAMATAKINTLDSSVSNAVINNGSYHYFLKTTSLDTNDEIWSARIRYTT